MRSLWILLALALSIAAPAATEPCRLCAPQEGGQTERARPMSLEIETSLDFDRIILLRESGGTARIGADGSWSSSGTVGSLSGRTMVGTVVIRGEPGRHIRVELPNRIDLSALNGSRITLQRLSTDLGPSPQLDSSGRLTFHFGGELQISGNADGDYRGDVPITVDYL